MRTPAARMLAVPPSDQLRTRKGPPLGFLLASHVLKLDLPLSPPVHPPLLGFNEKGAPKVTCSCSNLSAPMCHF